MGIFSREYAGSMEWEEIETVSKRGPQYVYRARVPGGWLVETQTYVGNCGGLAFLPDPNHEWNPRAS